MPDLLDIERLAAAESALSALASSNLTLITVRDALFQCGKNFDEVTAMGHRAVAIAEYWEKQFHEVENQVILLTTANSVLQDKLDGLQNYLLSGEPPTCP